MNLRDLEYFYQLAKSKSYTGTAQHFKVSQPTISYAIKRLEKELDCDLVIKDPSHRTAELTLQGDKVTWRMSYYKSKQQLMRFTNHSIL